MAIINDDILQLRFEGNGINLDSVKPSEVCDLIINLQGALLSTIKNDYPEIDIDNVLFSLDSIKNESLGINFRALRGKLLPQVRDIVITSFVLIATSISSNDFSKLNSATVLHVKKLATFSKEHNCNGEFNYKNETIAIITPKTEISEMKIPLIKSLVNIYGEIVDVGNNVHVKLNEGYNVIVTTDKATSKLLAPRLWDFVGLRGEAKWDIETFKIIDFKLKEVLDYNPGSLSEAFNIIRKTSASGWDLFNSNDEISKQLFRD